MHHHDHHHSHHSTNIQRVNRAFVGGIALNVLFVVVEAGSGFWTGSLSLLTDAGHNLSDVGSLGLSLLAFRMARFKSKNGYSYGYRKSTVLASLANALLLLLAMGRSWPGRHTALGSSSPEVPGITVAIVAGIGIFINAFTAWLFSLKTSTRTSTSKAPICIWQPMQPFRQALW